MAKSLFTEHIDSVMGTPDEQPSVPASPLTEHIDAVMSSSDLSDSLRLTVGTNPDEAAKARRLSRELDIPEGILPPLPVAEQEAFLKRLNPDQLKQDAPATANFLTNPDNARIVGRDVESLAKMEKTVLTSEQFTERVREIRKENPTLSIDEARAFAKLYPDSGKPKARSTTEAVLKDPLKAVASGANRAIATALEFPRMTPQEQLLNRALEVLAPDLLTAKRAMESAATDQLLRGADYWTKQKSEDIQERVEKFNQAGALESVKMLLSDPGLMVNQLAQSAVYTLPSMAFARAGVAATYAANTAMTALDAALSAREEAREAGLTLEEQDRAARISALVTAPFAFLGNKLARTGVLEAEFFTKGTIGGSLLDAIVREGIAGVFEEAGSAFGVNVSAQMYYDPTRQLLQGVPKAAAVGGILEATHGAGMSAVSNVVGATAVKLNRAIENHVRQEAQARRAQDRFEALRELSAQATENGVRKRSAETFREFVDTMTEGQNLEAVYVAPATLRAALADPAIPLDQITSRFPELMTAIQTAEQSGTDVEISTADYLTYLAGTPVEEKIIQELRTEPGGMTYSEANTFYQEQRRVFEEAAAAVVEEVQPVLTRQQFEQARAALEETVPVGREGEEGAPQGAPDNDIIQQAETYEEYLELHKNKEAVRRVQRAEVETALLNDMRKLGKFPASMNRAYVAPLVAFYETQAREMGISPRELYNRRPLRVTGTNFDPETVLSQIDPATPADFRPDKVADILKKDNWAILTAENPNNQPLPPEENAARMAELLERLQAAGFEHMVVEGFYNRHEHSVVVFGITQEEAVALGREFEQESVLTREGFVYQDGSITPTTGDVEVFDVAPDNNYTIIHFPDGAVSRFSVGLDFNTRIQPGEVRPIPPERIGALDQTQTPEFKRWFGDSVVTDNGKPMSEGGKPLVMYHGTGKDFSVFRRSDVAIFLTPDAEFAASFAETSATENGISDDGFEYTGANVMPVYVAAKNPFDYENTEHVEAVFDHVDRYQEGEVTKEDIAAGDFGTIESDEVQSAIAELGFDAFYVEEGGVKNLGVYSPRQIKSAIGNNGQFDPANQSIVFQDGPNTLKNAPAGTVPTPRAREARAAYLKANPQIRTNPVTEYVPVDKERAARIAEAYEQMEHNPSDPDVAAAYEALIKETLAQYEFILQTGLKIEFIPEGAPDPYAASPRLAIEDVQKNNHLWVFPTRTGFGTLNEITDNPLLAETPYKISGQTALANDIFRVVHDYFGHIAEGVGFRATGEENAWRLHSAMYSPLARKALTTETRGQNSWVNFGPYGEHNRTASGADTIYADQKVGLLPDWVVNEGSGQETRVGAVSVIGHHFSRVPHEILSGAYYGTGHKGAEAARVAEASDPRIKNRLYFYVDEGKGVFPEGGVGRWKHTVPLTNLYDGARNPLRLPTKNADGETDMNVFESAVIDAGFDGYYVEGAFHRQGAVVLLGDATKQVRVPQPAEMYQSAKGSVEERFRWRLEDFDAAVADYTALPGSRGGKVLDVDVARELSEDYLADRTLAQEVHEPASAFIKRLYAKKLAEAPQPGEKAVVLFTAGGGGAGKSTAIQSATTFLQESQIVYDGTLADYESAKTKIEQALAAGKEVQIALVVREPVEAFTNGVLSRAMRQAAEHGTGRIVKADVFIEAHTKAPQTVQRLAADYANDPRVHIVAFDNITGAPPVEINVADATKYVYNDLDARVYEALRRAYEEGQITQEIYDAIRTPTDEGVPSGVREGVREGVEGGGQEQSSNTVEQSPIFYSQLSRAIDSAKVDNIPAAQWKAWLTSNAPKLGIKKDEIQWTGITDWLDLQQGKVSKADIQAYLVGNGVQVQEVVLSAEELSSLYDTYTVPGGENYRELLLTLPVTVPEPLYVSGDDIRGKRDAFVDVGFTEDAVEAAAEFVDQSGSVDRALEFQTRLISQGYGFTRAQRDAGAILRAIITGQRNREREAQRQAFRSSHFDQPNILAHVRFDERTDADGNRVLFINEIQSDWGQEGKKKGFTTGKERTHTEIEIEMTKLNRARSALIDEAAALPDSAMEEFKRKNEEIKRLSEQLTALNEEWYRATESKNRVPPAPFVTDTKAWVSLAVKRMMRYAAENGFDKVALISGQQAADLYDLSKQIDSIEWLKNDRGYAIAADKGGVTVVEKSGLSESELVDTVGKEVAEKITSSEKQSGKLTGLDLQVGGEGMRAFYDQIVPQVVNDVLKKVGGGKVETLRFQEDGKYKIYLPDIDDFHNRQFNNKRDAEAFAEQVGGDVVPSGDFTEQVGFTITAEMKDAILAGLPLFQNQKAPRGSYNLDQLVISLLQGADWSTMIHESGHFFLEGLFATARMPEATPRMKEDAQKVLDWFGVTQEQWDSFDIEQKRPYHEQWAQSFERWAFEGVAPSLKLQPIFSRFMAWLKSVYRSMEDFLRQNPLAGKLNDEIRDVFSRLLASEQLIREAQDARSYAPLFKTAEEAGVSRSKFEAYMELAQEVQDESIARMQARSLRDMKWLNNAQSARLKELQQQANALRKQIREEVTKQVMAEPVNQAKTFLRYGKLTDPQTGEVVKVSTGHKISTDVLAALYPDGNPNNPDLSKLRGMTAKDGVDPDDIAPMFGFQSGDQMVRAIASAEDVQAKIEGLTDQRMLEEHGELVDERAIQRAVEESLHTEARARFMATGLTLLTKVGNTRQIMRAAKETAERVIGGKRVRDIKPAQYIAAETRANREAIKAAAKNPQRAAEAQRAAILNNRLAKAAMEAEAEVDSALRYLKKFTREGTRKNLDTEYLEQIDALLEPFDLRTGTTLRTIDSRTSLRDWMAQQEALGFEPIIDPELVAEARQKHYKNMTMDELRTLVDTVKSIEHLGRLKKKLLTAQDARDFETRIAEARESIARNANRTVKEKPTPNDALGRFGQFVRRMAAGHRKFASYIRELDGGKDLGVMANLLLYPMYEAGSLETDLRMKAAQDVDKLFEPIYPLLKQLGGLYSRRLNIPGTDFSLTTEERLMFALNWGNEGNRQRLLDGGIAGKRALTLNDVKAVLDTLTREEWQFVQGVWDYFETYRPLIAEQERMLTGKTPEWVEPSEIETKFGTMRGGYFPAKYDTNLSTRSEILEAVVDLRQAMKGAFNRAGTRNSYAQQRAEAVKNRPLLLSFDVISRHVHEVTHRLAWQAWLIDANRVLDALDPDIRQHLGVEALQAMREHVRDVAIGDAPVTGTTDVILKRIRTGTSIIGMGYRVSTALLQPAGIAQSWARLGIANIMNGIVETVKNPAAAYTFVMENSAFMRNRGKTMNREINEIVNQVRAGKKLTALQASYFFLITKLQLLVDIPTYLGAYNKALADLGYEQATSAEQRAKIEKKAHSFAGQTVIDTQTGGEIKDLANVQKGGQGQKLFTNFYSFFSALYNLNVENFRTKKLTDPVQFADFVATAMLLNVVPAVYSVILRNILKGECDWDDAVCLANRYKTEQMGMVFGQIIGVRELGAALDVATGGDYFGSYGPPSMRFFGEAMKLGVQLEQGEVDMALFKAANNMAGIVFHYPAGQINTTLEGMLAIENGEVEGAGMIGALISGPPR